MKEINITVPVTAKQYSELSPAEDKLVHTAIEALEKAYAPYSKFRVGAAIQLDNGQIVTGANQENVAYPSGTCAERSACYWAGANYPEAKFEAIAIAARAEDGELTANPTAPCGACRQALLEYEMRAGRPVPVILAGRNEVYFIPSVTALLPLAFTEF